MALDKERKRLLLACLLTLRISSICLGLSGRFIAGAVSKLADAAMCSTIDYATEAIQVWCEKTKAFCLVKYGVRTLIIILTNDMTMGFKPLSECRGLCPNCFPHPPPLALASNNRSSRESRCSSSRRLGRIQSTTASHAQVNLFHWDLRSQREFSPVGYSNL